MLVGLKEAAFKWKFYPKCAGRHEEEATDSSSILPPHWSYCLSQDASPLSTSIGYAFIHGIKFKALCEVAITPIYSELIFSMDFWLVAHPFWLVSLCTFKKVFKIALYSFSAATTKICHLKQHKLIILQFYRWETQHGSPWVKVKLWQSYTMF